MDLEGTDGRERGEDDTAFEKQTALFSLAVADIVLINIWCHDIGREQASNKPLLKTVFQVMTRLFSPRKTTMMFVVRDKTRTPMEILEPILREDVQKIWDSVPKPGEHKDTPLTDFFNVEVTALSNYEEKEEQFMAEVKQLSKHFQNSVAPGGLAGDRRAVVPGTGFPFSTHEMWKVIKENKDLDLPAHKVMVATVRCDEIAHEKLQALTKDEEWRTLQEESRGGAIPGFGKRVSLMLEKYVSQYDAEAGFFDEGVRTAKRNYLISEALDMMQPAYDAVIGNHRSAAFEKFKADLKAVPESSDQDFAATVRQFSEKALSSFDQACAGTFHSCSYSYSSRCNVVCFAYRHFCFLRTGCCNFLIRNFKLHVQMLVSPERHQLGIRRRHGRSLPGTLMYIRNPCELRGSCCSNPSGRSAWRTPLGSLCRLCWMHHQRMLGYPFGSW